MTERIREASPRLQARIAGLFYLLIFVVGIWYEFFVRDKLVVMSDAAATAHNILAHPSLYRLGGTAELVVLMCDISVAIIFYELFEPVSRSLSLFAVVFRLVFASIMAVNTLNYLAPLALLKSPGPLAAFQPDQLQALALSSLRSYGTAYEIALVFFGIHCILIGFLIFRSTFLPRILGVLMAFAGLGWVAFLWPPFTYYLYPYILLPGLIGEGLLTLWLLVMGVNAQRWMEQAGAAKQWRL
jgi:hypothetical protein